MKKCECCGWSDEHVRERQFGGSIVKWAVCEVCDESGAGERVLLPEDDYPRINETVQRLGCYALNAVLYALRNKS